MARRGAAFLTFAVVLGVSVPGWGVASRPVDVRIPVPTYISYSAFPNGAGNDAHAYWLSYPEFTVYVPVPGGLPSDVRWRLARVPAPPHDPTDAALQFRGSLTATD